jgi:hypothetical protein
MNDKIKTKQEIKDQLKLFIEAYHKTRIIDSTNDGIFKTHILLSKNKNNTPKEKLINYKLLRINEKMFESETSEISLKDSVVCEFLVDELLKYVSKSLKKV